MTVSVIAELPAFDTGQYEDCEFILSGNIATLKIKVAGLTPIHFRFARVRWHQFTAVYNCTPEMARDAYFRLVEYTSSTAVAQFVQRDQASRKAYKRLGHYRIFLDETGCHEVFAESASAL